jgi:tetraacyldisaccharide 4'-kinase
VARDRAAAGQAAAAAGAQAVVMDDGFQNPCLAKDLSIVVVDAGFGFGNGRVVPAGPLREPVPDGLARADLLLAVGPDPARLLAGWPGLAARPMLTGEIAPLATGMTWNGLRALAFAGIGRPEKFYTTLRGLGVELAATRSFADHAPYGAPLFARLESAARSKRAQLVTTEKDAVRLPAAMRAKVLVLPVRLEIADWAPLDDALAATTAESLPNILPISDIPPPTAPDLVSVPRATGENPNKS